jgi:cardiolipin synthase A/B
VEIIIRHTLVVVGFLLAVVIVARLLREHRAPGNTMAWLLAIILIPYVGVPLYLIFGGRQIGRLSQHREPLPLEAPDPEKPFTNETEHVLCATGIPRSRAQNRILMLADAQSAYRGLVDMIERARHSLNIATFILGNDEVGADIIQRLAKRAKEGIKVRLLLDALGSFWCSKRFLAPLRQAGGEVAFFLPVIPYRRKWSANLRNHRKIWIADEKLAVVGGRNIAVDYMGPEPLARQWPDYSMEIVGPAVDNLFNVFGSDWEFATRQRLEPRRVTPPGESGDKVRMQIVAAGPDTQSGSLYQGVLASIVGASERIWIVTPYFIPDETFVKALTLAAQLGRDVRILLPLHSNHRLADLARGSYLRELASHGVKCLAYQPGMLHTKLVLIDEEIAVVGSVNMDMRSLYLNFEIAAFVYSPEPIMQIEEHIRLMMEKSLPFSLNPKTRADHTKLWFEDISRLFAPLL